MEDGIETYTSTLLENTFLKNKTIQNQERNLGDIIKEMEMVLNDSDPNEEFIKAKIKKSIWKSLVQILKNSIDVKEENYHCNYYI